MSDMSVEKAYGIIQKVVERDMEITVIPLPVAVCILDIFERLDSIEKRLDSMEKRNERYDTTSTNGSIEW